jgi:hypothetical protein
MEPIYSAVCRRSRRDKEECRKVKDLSLVFTIDIYMKGLLTADCLLTDTQSTSKEARNAKAPRRGIAQTTTSQA